MYRPLLGCVGFYPVGCGGVQDRGLSHAMVKRLEALVWQNWPYTSGRAALRALLSSRLLMISFQRRMKFLVLSSSTPFSSRSALSSARMASAWAPAPSAGPRWPGDSSRGSQSFSRSWCGLLSICGGYTGGGGLLLLALNSFQIPFRSYLWFFTLPGLLQLAVPS